MTAKPPAWVTGEPDKHGVYSGPAVHIDPPALSIYTGWSAKAGAFAWMDAALYHGEILAVAEMDAMIRALQAARARVAAANKVAVELDITRVTRIKAKTEVSIWPADGDHDHIELERGIRQAPDESIELATSMLLADLHAAVMAKVVA